MSEEPEKQKRISELNAIAISSWHYTIARVNQLIENKKIEITMRDEKEIIMSEELEQHVNDLIDKASQNCRIISTPPEEKDKSEYIGGFSIIHKKEIIANFKDIEDADEFRAFKLRQIVESGDTL